MSKANGRPLTVGELIEELSNYDEYLPVAVFAAGSTYPALSVQDFEGDVEIGGGWVENEY